MSRRDATPATFWPTLVELSRWYDSDSSRALFVDQTRAQAWPDEVMPARRVAPAVMIHLFDESRFGPREPDVVRLEACRATSEPDEEDGVRTWDAIRNSRHGPQFRYGAARKTVELRRDHASGAIAGATPLPEAFAPLFDAWVAWIATNPPAGQYRWPKR